MKINYHFFLFLFFFLFISVLLTAQNRKYLYTGAEVEVLKDATPLSLIISDFNNHHKQLDLNTILKPSVPSYIPGFMIGTKVHSRFSEFGGNVHFMKYDTQASGVGYDGIEYDESLSYTHIGFCLHYNVAIINTNYFRTGPGIGFKLEQFRIKLKDNEDINYNTEYPVDRALISGRIYYTISLGGPKFNFDIVGFYHIPYKTLSLETLNKHFNDGFHTEYPENELQFNTTSYGISIYIGLGSKENYDF